MAVRSDVSQEAWKGGLEGGLKRVSSADDWLIDTTQTARERSRNIIRTLQVRDRLTLKNWYRIYETDI